MASGLLGPLGHCVPHTDWRDAHTQEEGCVEPPVLLVAELPVLDTLTRHRPALRKEAGEPGDTGVAVELEAVKPGHGAVTILCHVAGLVSAGGQIQRKSVALLIVVGVPGLLMAIVTRSQGRRYLVGNLIIQLHLVRGRNVKAHVLKLEIVQLIVNGENGLSSQVATIKQRNSSMFAVKL